MEQTALVSGGDMGIGRATVRKLKDSGYTVYMLGHDEEDTKAAASEEGVSAIVANLDDVPTSLTSVTDVFNADSGLSVLVNAATSIESSKLEKITPALYDKLFNLNFRVPVFLCQALLPALEKNKGCIINLSSIITRRGRPGFTMYAASKGALEAFTRNLAQETADRNIRVNAISPGAIDNPQLVELLEKEDIRNELISSVPLGRMGGPMDVAEVIMAQINSKYVTGSIWSVDGGVSS